MRLFNLTDQPLPKQRDAIPQPLRKSGIVIEPGEYVDVPKGFPLKEISGWINGGKVAVGKKPAWYVKAREAARDAVARKPARKPVPEERRVSKIAFSFGSTNKGG